MKIITNKINILLALVLLNVINVCSAAPNLWNFGMRQGIGEYGIANEQGDTLTISCNIGAGEQMDNTVSLTLANQQTFDSDAANTAMEFVIADESYPIPAMTIGIQGSGAWDKFIYAIRSARHFEIYVNDKKLASFSPNPNNVKKVLKDMDCDSLAGKEWQ